MLDGVVEKWLLDSAESYGFLIDDGLHLYYYKRERPPGLSILISVCFVRPEFWCAYTSLEFFVNTISLSLYCSYVNENI